jgi:hypothetical protein
VAGIAMCHLHRHFATNVTEASWHPRLDSPPAMHAAYARSAASRTHVMTARWRS